MRRRSTIKDIALAAGVSVAAVSAVLSGKAGASIRVSEETKEKIRATARELDYVPNQRARSLREGQSRILTVITYEKVFPVDWRNEFYRFFVGIEEEAARQGYDILILNNRPGREPGADGSAGSFDRMGLSDGAVVIGISKDEAHLIRFHNAGFPLIFVGRREIAGIEPDYVTFDYDSPIRELVGRIAGAGFGLVSFFAVGCGEPLEDKRAFLRAACAQEGLAIAEYGPDALPEPQDMVRSGSFVIFNTMAIADTFCALARGCGLEPGREYEAAVLEDRWQDENPLWTRLDSDRVELGRTAVARLVSMVARPESESEPVRILIPVHLVDGDSSPSLGTGTLGAEAGF